MLKGIHHIAITSADLDRLLDFYQTLFGGEILSSFDWQEGNEALDLRLGLEASAGRIVMMGFGDMRIEFFQFSVPENASPPRSTGHARAGNHQLQNRHG